jgi:hypothetical protein
MREQPLNNEMLHPVLDELPEFQPSADLWPRIAAAHAKTRRAPRPYRWLGAAAAAAAVVAALIVAVPRAPRDSGLVEGQNESQELEHEWQSLSPAAARPSGLARLQMIDAALQSAYDRGAQADELKPLWKQRNDALRGLILTAQTDTVTRI